MFDMHGKVTIITGGSGGIGYEVARGLAEAGSDIALWYHKSPNASKLAKAIENDLSSSIFHLLAISRHRRHQGRI